MAFDVLSFFHIKSLVSSVKATAVKAHDAVNGFICSSVKSKIDYLRGLKENLIIGKLIPAGTGITAYRHIELPVIEHEDEIAMDETGEPSEFQQGVSEI